MSYFYFLFYFHSLKKNHFKHNNKLAIVFDDDKIKIQKPRFYTLNKIKVMKNKMYYSLFILLFSFNLLNATNQIDLIAAQKMKGLIFKVEGLGGHSEYCVAINVQNSTSQTITIMVNPGILMVPKDSSLQDLLIVEQKEIQVSPGQKVITKLRGFCAASKKHSPGANSSFKITLGNNNLIQLAQYIDKHPKIKGIQSAVWVVANGIPISSVYSKDSVFVQLISNLSGQPVPDYTVEYAELGSAAFSGVPTRVKGEISYTVWGEDEVSFQIYDARGELRKTVFKNRLSFRGEHKEMYDIDISKLKSGTYFIRIYQQNQLLKEKKIII